MAKYPGSVLNVVVDGSLKKLAKTSPRHVDRDQLVAMGVEAPAMAREILRLRELLQLKNETPWEMVKRGIQERG